MTINKVQGQTMKIIGIYLPEPIFTHNQLYVTLSQATRVNDVSVFCPTGRTMTMLFIRNCCDDLSSLSLACFFSFDGLGFSHPNHGLKFLALDAKMVAMEATFTMCGC